MKDIIDSYFSEKKIEYYSVLDFSDCRVTNNKIMARMGFSPKSAIIFLVPYFVSVPKNLSAYAASLDYHLIIKELCDGLIVRLKEEFSQYSFCGYGDHSPIDERSAALIANLGILGDSGLIINEKYGTYVFIADLLTDAPSELLRAAIPAPVRFCSHCGACMRACPTGVLRGEGDDCLSAITQRKGELTEREIEFMRKNNTLWGCDICQSVCPHNKFPVSTPIDFFYEERIDELTSKVLESLDDESFSKRAFAWRGRKTVERNIGYLEEN